MKRKWCEKKIEYFPDLKKDLNEINERSHQGSNKKN